MASKTDRIMDIMVMNDEDAGIDEIREILDEEDDDEEDDDEDIA